MWVKTLDAIVIIKLHALFDISFGYGIYAIKSPSDIYPLFIHTQGPGHSRQKEYINSFAFVVGTYSWVRNNSSLSRTHVSRSTEPHLARFFILICREHKNMSCAFSCTVAPCCLFWHCRPSIVEYKTWSTSCSDWQFFCYSVRWWCQGRVRKKTANEIPAEGNCR